MMNDTERITALESEIADLKLRLARVEADYAALAASRETLHRETDETVQLFKAYWDQRLGGVLQQRLASVGGDDPVVEELTAFMKLLGELLGQSLADLERTVLLRVDAKVTRLLDQMKALVDSIAAAQR
jgi:hypothetical protein